VIVVVVCVFHFSDNRQRQTLFSSLFTSLTPPIPVPVPPLHFCTLYSLLTLIFNQPQPPPNIAAYNIALDGLDACLVLVPIGTKCLSQHSCIEEAIYIVEEKGGVTISLVYNQVIN